MEALDAFYEQLYYNIIYQDRWLWYLEGLANTLLITLIAITIGTVLGAIGCMCKLSNIKILNKIASIYVYVIRGTPTVLQLLIIYYGVLKFNAPLLIGAIAFGINSGAYVTEIMRSGFLAVDKGQIEAGRSLGLSKFHTLRYVITPQAIKNFIPTFVSEFVVLIKETAVIGAYLPVEELTKKANNVANTTYNFWIPYIVAGILYLIVTGTLTFIFSRLERRLRDSDKR